MAVNPITEHTHIKMLRAIYADLTRLGEFTTADVVLHSADRSSIVAGRDAVVAHERTLIDLTGGTLVMDVNRITANDYFGAVLGTFRASHPYDFAIPFCGLWRFVDHRIAEHWENLYDLAALPAQFTQRIKS